MNTFENIQMKGEVAFRVYRNGEIVEDTKLNNLILNGGRQALARLAGISDPDKRVTQVGFGTGTLPTLPTDSTLTSPFTKVISSVSYVGNSVIFAFSLEQVEYNGNSITEFGLYCDDGTLFSRLIRTPIVKDATIRLDCTWTLTF